MATLNPPSGFTYGREWPKSTLDDQTSTTTDTDGHGTHVMGIAGGNGRGTGNGQPQYQYIGVAPEATLVGVKTDYSDAGVVDGVDYIFQKAAGLGMNAVVNLSLGGQFGPHDGTDPFDVAISNLAGAGKIVVVSAGNERADQIHARGQLPTAGSPTTLDFQFTLDAYTKLSGSQNDLVLFDGYYESTDNYSVTVIGPNGQTLGPVARGSVNSIDSSDGAIQIDNGTATSSTGDYEVFIALFDYNSLRAPKAGVWTIRYTRVTSTNSNIDLWNYYTASHMSGRFTSSYTPDVTIGSPGSALAAITVAAYTGKSTWTSINGSTYSWNPLPTLGAIASFSSRGPLRDGTQKPDIAGPGFGVVSTLSSGVATSGLEPYIVPDGKHWIQAGTSMSSPMVSGLAALVLKKEGAITPAQMKTALANERPHRPLHRHRAQRRLGLRQDERQGGGHDPARGDGLGPERGGGAHRRNELQHHLDRHRQLRGDHGRSLLLHRQRRDVPERDRHRRSQRRYLRLDGALDGDHHRAGQGRRQRRGGQRGRGSEQRELHDPPARRDRPRGDGQHAQRGREPARRDRRSTSPGSPPTTSR